MQSHNGNKQTPLWVLIALDLLLVGVILVAFAFFHHVLPTQIAEHRLQQLLEQQAEPCYDVMEETKAAVSDCADAEGLTEWQMRFADHFTDKVVITENSYTSPEVCVTIETVVETINRQQVTYYVADVYVASLDNFKTYTAHDQMFAFVSQDSEEMAVASNAIFAISGDYFSNQKNGFLLRNSEVYANNRNNSICVLFPDGTMETYDRGTYKIEDIMARDPVQVWSFGPVLLDANGAVRESYSVSNAIRMANPRSAIGYYEPGHYLLVVVDGRQKHSYGMTIPQLAQIFADRGCECAYNLDGGGSAVALFGGKNYSKPSVDRKIADIVVVTEDGYTPHKKETK